MNKSHKLGEKSCHRGDNRHTSLRFVVERMEDVLLLQSFERYIFPFENRPTCVWVREHMGFRYVSCRSKIIIIFFVNVVDAEIVQRIFVSTAVVCLPRPPR